MNEDFRRNSPKLRKGNWSDFAIAPGSAELQLRYFCDTHSAAQLAHSLSRSQLRKGRLPMRIYRVATLIGLMAAVTTSVLFGATAAEDETKQTWFVYGSALLSDQKTVVVTRLLNVEIAGASPAEIDARTTRMKAKLQRELTEHITTKMHREVVSVETVCDLNRFGAREKRDGEISARRTSGKMRTIFLNGFNFSFGKGD